MRSLQKCRFSCTSRPTRTPVTSLLKGRFDTCRPGTPHLDVHRFPFLGACWMNGPIRCKTEEPRSVPVRAHFHKFFYVRTLSIASCELGSDHFQLFFQLPACPAVAEIRSLSQDGYSYNKRSRTETPRREEWSVSSFSRRCVPLHSVCVGPPFPNGSHLPSGLASGSREAVSLPVDWCAWENNPTRDSWEHVGAPGGALRGWLLFPHVYLGATASDLVSVGESVCIDERLSFQWC